MILQVLITCAALSYDPIGFKKPFLVKSQAEADALIASEYVGHPEVYPQDKCSVAVSDVTAAMAAADAKVAADQAAAAQRNALLAQAKSFLPTLQNSQDPRDKALLYFLRKELNQ